MNIFTKISSTALVFVILTLTFSLHIANANMDIGWDSIHMPVVTNLDRSNTNGETSDQSNDNHNYTIIHAFYYAPTGGHSAAISCQIHEYNSHIIVCHRTHQSPPPGSIVTQAFVLIDASSKRLYGIRPKDVEKLVFINESGYSTVVNPAQVDGNRGFIREEIVGPCKYPVQSL